MDRLTKQAITATLHCLTGCATGEILGMVMGNALNLHGALSVLLSIVLAFIFGYGLSMFSLCSAGLNPRRTIRIALAADTVSIGSMELVDNLVVVLIPGALGAGLTTPLFWGSLLASLIIAFVVTVPVNRFLIGRGKGMRSLIGTMHTIIEQITRP